MNERLRHKTLLVCGIVCSLCGVIIFILSLLDADVPSYSRIVLGVINIINGLLFLGLSRSNSIKK